MTSKDNEETIGRPRPEGTRQTERQGEDSYYRYGYVGPNILDLGFALTNTRMRMFGGLFSIFGNTLANAAPAMPGRSRQSDPSRDGYDDNYYSGYGPGNGRRASAAVGEGVRDVMDLISDVGDSADRLGAKQRRDRARRQNEDS